MEHLVTERPGITATSGLHILRLSAPSVETLDALAARLADDLRRESPGSLDEVAAMLRGGPEEFAHRLCVVARDAASAIAALDAGDHALRAKRRVPSFQPSIVFMFPGQGTQYPGMGADLYVGEPAFRAACDEVFAAVHGVTSFDLREQMFAGDAAALMATAVTQPATFCLEYALAKLWQARGLAPRVMLGHSVGEFVAAALAGVMTVADAARLVARRGALMHARPGGSMLSVRLGAETLRTRLPAALSLAADNAPSACVVAGPVDAVAAFAADLEADGIVCRALQTSHAFHSAMMDPVLSAFAADLRTMPLSPPQVPIVSTLTGTWLRAEDAVDPAYWTRHLRETVRFSTAVQTLLDGEPSLFLEVGARHSLCALVRQHACHWPGEKSAPAVATLTDGPMSERESFALAIGQLWLAGVDLETPSPAGSNGQAIAITAVPAPPTAPTDMIAPVSHHRRASLVSRLRTVIEDVGGIAIDDGETATAFVALGLDSLALTQVAIQLRKTFGVPVTFRQLMEQCRSVDSLAVHLEALLPPDAEPDREPSPAPLTARADGAATPAATGASSSVPHTTFAQQVVAQQLAIMEQQLALLGELPGSAAPRAVPPTRIAPATPAPRSDTTPADDVAALAHTRYDVKKAFGAIARIHTSPTTELTDRQQQRLEAFIRSYTARTTASKAYTERHRPHLADPRVVNGFRPQTKELCYQIVIERSKGSRMWDLDGNEYIDALNGFGMSLFGWQPEFVNEAVKQQIDRGHDIGPQHPLAGEVAELLCELTGFDRAGLCNTGSEAVMGALRIARTVTARNLVVAFTGSYHGIFDEVLVRGTRTGRAVPAAPGILQAAVENVLILDYGTPESLEIIRSRAHELAAVLVEPVQSRRPEFQPVEFLRDVRRITEESGTVLIFDEVITGFRSHQRGAQGLFGIQADVATYGKVIGGGYPIGVIAGKREFMDALDGGAWEFGDDSIPTVGVTYFAGTFVRHPLALAACKAALLHMKERGPTLQAALSARTTAMADELNAFIRSTGAPLEIRHFASLWRVAFTEEHPLQDLLWAMMRTRGIHILDNFPCFLTTAHSESDIGRITGAFKDALAEMIASGFLPGKLPEVAPSVDSSRPPVPNARLGRDRDGSPAWFVPDPATPGQYVKVTQ